MGWKGRGCAQEDTFEEQNILSELGSKTGTSSQLRKERHCLRELPQAPPPRYALRYHWQQVSHPGPKFDRPES